LLTPRKRNDKSQWLARGGYSLERWEVLEKDLREQILSKDATMVENTVFGPMYEIKGDLAGPNGKGLSVCTIWLTEVATGFTKFITMYPFRRR
jgi:hypothetical protein